MHDPGLGISDILFRKIHKEIHPQLLFQIAYRHRHVSTHLRLDVRAVVQIERYPGICLRDRPVLAVLQQDLVITCRYVPPYRHDPHAHHPKEPPR